MLISQFQYRNLNKSKEPGKETSRSQTWWCCSYHDQSSCSVTQRTKGDAETIQGEIMTIFRIVFLNIVAADVGAHSNRFLLSASKERVTQNCLHRKFLETTNSKLLPNRTWTYAYKDIYICCRQIEIQVHISIFEEQVTKRDNQSELSYKYSNPLLPQRLIQTKQFWAFLLGITPKWEGSPLVNQIWQ